MVERWPRKRPQNEATHYREQKSEVAEAVRMKRPEWDAWNSQSHWVSVPPVQCFLISWSLGMTHLASSSILRLRSSVEARQSNGWQLAVLGNLFLLYGL